MTFTEIENLRMRQGVTAHAMCQRAGIAPSVYYRARQRGSVRPLTGRRWLAVLNGSNIPARRREAQNPELIRSVYRGYMLALAHRFFPGLPHEAAALEALAQAPARKANSDPRWAAASRARELAIYCTVIDLGLPGNRVAGAIGVTRAAVSAMLRRVEDLRGDDPTIDTMIETAARLIAGPGSAEIETGERGKHHE